MDELQKIIESKYDCRHYPLKSLIAMNLGRVLCAADYAGKRNAPYLTWP